MLEKVGLGGYFNKTCPDSGEKKKRCPEPETFYGYKRESGGGNGGDYKAKTHYFFFAVSGVGQASGRNLKKDKGHEHYGEHRAYLGPREAEMIVEIKGRVNYHPRVEKPENEIGRKNAENVPIPQNF